MMSNGNAGRPLELYIHVPFCVRKCLYCDFYSYPGTDAEEKAFFEHLFREVRETPFSGEVRSVFIGGGTPSVADPSRIRETLSVLRAQFPFRADAEISMEANPGTVTEEKLSVYRDAGINRLSIGMQSADDGMLASIGRIHRFSDVAETVKQARAAGFRNLNLDLISGLPGETAESFENTLFQALSMEPEPLSV